MVTVTVVMVKVVIYVAFMVYERASATGVIILFINIDFEAGFCESSSGCYTSNSSTWPMDQRIC